ncbi:RHS repeat domain-containing protein [Aquimarina sp. 2201CG14-23]|uniref:RHS repeat domain-containing protein n=1 Tax=Aquimarina mycalae TaxID=3040073 RepID=UPI0024782DE7|nr:RHS repeat-associated core domain-containing protein [Aquimarina sp. 2201CG14-23]MDH7448035.1 RHS repeat-associated core domain-containing protein [Aquimarina sp. 2201CG14-23]
MGCLKLHIDTEPILSVAYRKKGQKVSKNRGSYYPFGLEHKGYNQTITGRKHNYGYNGVEEENELGLNMFSMDFRKYDPTIARWTAIDPVTHHSLSPYNSFDNNPIFWADPSGANSEKDRMDAKSKDTYFREMNGLAPVFASGGNSNDCCGGSGTESDPFQLEEVVINGSTGGGQGGFDADTPDWLQNGKALSHWETQFEGSLSEYNAKNGVSFTNDHLYEQYYYHYFYEPELSALRGSMQAAQAEAAEYVGLILPMGGAVKGAMTLGRIGKLLNTAGRRAVLKFAKPHPFLYSFSKKTLRPGQGQLDAGHRAAAFLHKEIIMKGKFSLRKSDKAFIFNYTTRQGQKFSEIINPFTRRIFHQAPNHIKIK